MTHHEAPVVRLGATPGRLALIAVLAIVLVSVVVIQFGSDGATPEKADAPTESTADDSIARLPDTASRTSMSTTGLARKSAWPSMPLSEIVRHNPFQLPHRFQRPGAPPTSRPPSPDASEQARQQQARQELLRTLHEVGVSLIIDSGGERVAYVGDLALRVGQVIHGYRVVDIRPDGVLLKDSSGY